MVRVTEQYSVVCGWYFYDTSSVRLLIEVEMLEYKRGNIFKTVDKSTHIDYRRFYVEGAGQLCEECWNDIYDNSEEMLYYEE
jgi:hypothetical protein